MIQKEYEKDYKPPLSKAAKREIATGYLFISPWLFGFIFFMGGPIVASLVLSFAKWNGIGGMDAINWVGFDNFTKMIAEDRWRISVWNTFYYTVFAVPLSIVVGVAIALLMNQKFKSIAIFRTIFYLPSVTAGVASAVLWYFIFQPQFGLLNYSIRLMGEAFNLLV